LLLEITKLINQSSHFLSTAAVSSFALGRISHSAEIDCSSILAGSRLAQTLLASNADNGNKR